MFPDSIADFKVIAYLHRQIADLYEALADRDMLIASLKHDANRQTEEIIHTKES